MAVERRMSSLVTMRCAVGHEARQGLDPRARGQDDVLGAQDDLTAGLAALGDRGHADLLRDPPGAPRPRT